MNERNFDQLLDAWMDIGPTAAPDRVAAAARFEARSIPQTGAPGRSLPRRFVEINAILRLGFGVAIVTMAMLIGYAVLAGTVRIGPPSPSPTLAPTPMALPDSFETRFVTLDNGLVGTDLAIELPSDGSLYVETGSFPWRFAASDQPEGLLYTGAWGILVADVTGATNHVSRRGQDPIEGGDPREFLLNLEATGSYTVGEPRQTVIGGRDALIAAVALRSPAVTPPSGASDAEGYPHLDVNGEGGILFPGSSRVYVTQLDEHIILIQIWSPTDAELAIHRPLEDRIIRSIRVEPGP